MPESDSLEQLRQAVLQEARSLTAEQASGQPVGPRIENLVRLGHAYEASRLAAEGGRKRGSHWPAAVAVLIAFGVPTALEIVHRSSADVELDARAAVVSFTARVPHPFGTGKPLAEIAVSGTGHAVPPYGVRCAPGAPHEGTVEGAIVRAAPGPRQNRAGSVTLDPFMLPSQSDVEIGSAGIPGRVTVAAEGSVPQLAVNVDGSVAIALLPGRLTACTSQFPSQLLMNPDSGDVSLDLAFADSAERVFAIDLPISRLDFHRHEQLTTGEQAAEHDVSTIRSGTLVLEGLNAKSVQLREGEHVRLTRPVGELRVLAVSGGEVVVAFRGRVSDVALGSSGNERRLTPTWLEWLATRYSLTLCWGAAGLFLGALIPVLRWWRGS